MPTLKDIAQKIGCSEATVSLVLNNKPGVNAETRKRVTAVSQEMGYAPNSIARSLAMKKTNTIGLVVTDIENPFFGSLVHHISSFAQSHNYALLIATSEDNLKQEEENLRVFMSHQVDGIIIVPTQEMRTDYTIFELLEQRNVPYVFAVSYYPQYNSDYVLSNYSAGSYNLTKYLLELGHRNILHLAGADLESPINRDRLQGYKQAYVEAGIFYDPNRIILCNQPVFYSGYYQTKKILQHELPDAIIAINDVLALGAKKAASEFGLSIPHDISIAGYDDVIFSSLFETPLTTVRQNIASIAEKSVNLILRKIDTGASLMEKILVEPELIVRQTTGPNLRSHKK